MYIEKINVVAYRMLCQELTTIFIPLQLVGKEASPTVLITQLLPHCHHQHIHK